jgi:prophage antirepressor-like protein
MNEVMPFQFENVAIRVVTDENGEPLFVGKDICEALGYANPSKAMNDHCKGVTIRYPLQTTGGMQQLRVLTEPDVMRLMVGSTLPAAQAFERLVFEEILPTIRKTGSYVSPAVQQSRTPAEPMLPVQQAKVSLECFLDVAKLLAVPTHLAQTESIKQVRLTTGVDFSPFLLLAPAQNDIQAEEVMLEPTELGAALGYSRNKINPALEAAGLQERVDGVWAPTAKGAKFCIRHHWQVGNKSGYNLKWNLQAVRQLVPEAEKKAA